jgi:hypothetical protein
MQVLRDGETVQIHPNRHPQLLLQVTASLRARARIPGCLCPSLLHRQALLHLLPRQHKATPNALRTAAHGMRAVFAPFSSVSWWIDRLHPFRRSAVHGVNVGPIEYNEVEISDGAHGVTTQCGVPACASLQGTRKLHRPVLDRPPSAPRLKAVSNEDTSPDMF